MTDPLVVLVFVVGQAAEAPSAAILSDAARQALGGDAALLVESRATWPTEVEELERGRRVHAHAVAQISWQDDSATQAKLRLYVPDGAGWAEHRATFSPNDAHEERQRALGFLLGAMVRRRNVVSSAPPAWPAASPDAAPEDEPRSPLATPAPIAAIDLTAAASLGIGGKAGLYGAMLRGQWLFHPAISARAGLGARSGPLEEAGATSSLTAIWMGVSVRLLSTGGARPFELRGCVDLGALRHAVRRSDPEASRSRWVTASAVALEGAWYVAPSFGVVASAGTELAWGATPVTLDGDRVATIPPGRFVTEVGVRARF
jgi:hypothetical protein